MHSAKISVKLTVRYLSLQLKVGIQLHKAELYNTD